MVAMKKIVLSCKNITEDIEKHETKESPDLSKFKTDLSVALTQLMSAAKTHATNPSSDTTKNISITSSVLLQTVARLVNAVTTVEDIVVEAEASKPKDSKQLKVKIYLYLKYHSMPTHDLNRYFWSNKRIQS